MHATHVTLFQGWQAGSNIQACQQQQQGQLTCLIHNRNIQLTRTRTPISLAYITPILHCNSQFDLVTLPPDNLGEPDNPYTACNFKFGLQHPHC